jgi:diaminohydroxyphosphoribosylaminopyrimidine deaminase/5-amino-6-(5-phosphoribosylamino)uracil reductase
MIRWFNHPKDELLRDLALPGSGTPCTPEAAQNLALAVALRGLGSVSPNPLVGAVLLDSANHFVGAAAHERLGGLHAEARLLADLTKSLGAKALQQKLKGGRLFVTLEPCAHEGRTPSCARALAGSGLKEVIYGVIDPNPLVRGKGAGILREAGINAVDASSHSDFKPWSAACEDLAGVFRHNISTGRIFTGLKIASSMDGVVAFEGDRRIWITGERARAYGHFLRMAYDAIAVGAGTVLADHPRLNVRHPFLKDPSMSRTPRRVVVDPRGRALEFALGGNLVPLVTEEPETTVWLIAHHGVELDLVHRAEARGIKVIAVPIEPESGRFIWSEVDGALQALGIRSVLLEGGAGLYASALGSGDGRTRPFVNKIHLFQSPQILGDRSPAGAKALRWNTSASRQLSIRQDRVQLFQLDCDWGFEIPLDTAAGV